LLFYYITDRTQFPGAEAERRSRLLAKIAEAARAGVDYVQLREKDLSGRELELLAREVARVIESSGSRARLLINSRTDIALAVGAAGVHLRSNDISPAEARQIWRTAGRTERPLIAVSCHTEAEVRQAVAAGADFVVYGPVFQKKGSETIGADELRHICEHRLPVFALGGITGENAQSCVESGARGIAGIRLFQENDIAELVTRLSKTK
jgi:thiamine-phosphate pyrophosphorylase